MEHAIVSVAACDSAVVVCGRAKKARGKGLGECTQIEGERWRWTTESTGAVTARSTELARSSRSASAVAMRTVSVTASHTTSTTASTRSPRAFSVRAVTHAVGTVAARSVTVRTMRPLAAAMTMTMTMTLRTRAA